MYVCIHCELILDTLFCSIIVLCFYLLVFSFLTMKPPDYKQIIINYHILG